MRSLTHSLMAAGALLLASCTSAPVGPPPDTAAREAEARAALESGDYAVARDRYAVLVEQLQGEARIAASLGLARAETGLGRPEAALALLDAMPPALPGTLDAERASVRAAAYFALGRTAEAIRLLLEREIWLETSAEILDNQAQIWEGLEDPASAAAASQRTGDNTVDGWLALAPLTRLAPADPQFRDALIAWRDEFPDHPATAGILAERLAAYRGADSRPAKIALLLPLTSERRAEAQAIQDGFFAAHFASGFVEDSTIQIYDTGQRGGVESFLTAQLDNSDFVVGPLLADEVERVQSQAGFVPTLALNLGAEPAAVTTNFFQFALSSDDEIEAIAAEAIAEGHETAVILHASSDRGYRQMRGFSEAFEAQGGRVLNAVAYSRTSQTVNLSAPIENLLNITESEARYRRLVSGLGRAVEFEPRRRADIDMLFLQTDPGAGPADARLLAPLLRDNGAGPEDLPTFATSDIYDPTRASAEPDLNGLIFPDVPLLIAPEGGARQAAASLSQLTTTSAEQRKRLYAFGFDAYQLIARLYSPSAARWPLPGATGELYLDDTGRIRRILPFASFQDGRPRSLTQSPVSFGAR